MIPNNQKDIFILVIIGLLLALVSQNFQQNHSSQINQLQQKILERDATIKVLTEAVQKSTKKEEEISVNKISIDETSKTNALANYGNGVNTAEINAIVWQQLSNYYQKIAEENAEKFQKCSSEKKGLQQTNEDLNGNLDQKKAELKTCENVKRYYYERLYGY